MQARMCPAPPLCLHMRFLRIFHVQHHACVPYSFVATHRGPTLLCIISYMFNFAVDRCACHSGASMYAIFDIRACCKTECCMRGVDAIYVRICCNYIHAGFIHTSSSSSSGECLIAALGRVAQNYTSILGCSAAVPCDDVSPACLSCRGQ